MGALEVTPEHPFWVEERGWVGAGELAAGDLVGNAEGAQLRWGGKSAPRSEEVVYALEVKLVDDRQRPAWDRRDGLWETAIPDS